MSKIELPSADDLAALDAADVPATLAALSGLQAALLAKLLEAERAPRPEPVGPAYSLTEAAALLMKSPAWLRRRAAAGRVPGARRVGRSWQFSRTLFDRARERGMAP